MSQFGLFEGRRLRDEGVRAVEDGPEERQRWREEARAWVRARAARPGTFAPDDLTLAVGVPPTPNLMGAVWLWANRQGLVEPVGFTQATRASAHGRRVLVYRGLVPL